jgi:hypothetical protein
MGVEGRVKVQEKQEEIRIAQKEKSEKSEAKAAAKQAAKEEEMMELLDEDTT